MLTTKPLPAALRIGLFLVGTVTFILGLIGVFLPILPTTPFWLITAACYIRASDRIYGWFINNRFIGEQFHHILAGRGVPLRTKIISISLGWSVIGYTVLFVIDSPALKVVLVGVMLLQAFVLLRMKTYRAENTAPTPE